MSNKVLSLEDVQRVEQHAHVTLQTKAMWSDTETAAALHQALFGSEGLPPHTSALVMRAAAYLHQNYGRSLQRWDYLNRYRILRATARLCEISQSIVSIAHQVGFRDAGYFRRIFSTLAGLSPRAYRERAQEEQ